MAQGASHKDDRFYCSYHEKMYEVLTANLVYGVIGGDLIVFY